MNSSQENSSKKEKSINRIVNQNLEFYGLNAVKRSRNKAKRIIKIENENEYYNRTSYRMTKDNFNGISEIFKTNNSLFTSSKIMKTSIQSSISNYLHNYSSHNKKNINNPTKVFNNEKTKSNASDLSNSILKNNFFFDNYKMKNQKKKKKEKKSIIKKRIIKIHK